jgi:PAP_fibrillin
MIMIMILTFLLHFILYNSKVTAFRSVSATYIPNRNNVDTVCNGVTQGCLGRYISEVVTAKPTLVLHSTKISTNIDEIMDSIATFFGKSNDETNNRSMERLRQERKQALLSLVASTNTQDNKVVVPMSKEIDDAIDALAELSPVTSTIELSQQLEKTWYLIWTTEKEINLFLNNGWSDNITQQIINDDTIVNTIPFVNDNGYFGVRGRIYRQIEDPFIRTQFVFETATLQLSRISWLPALSFPPVGKGWFDTVYLDNNFRVDRNSRNDILICQSLE